MAVDSSRPARAACSSAPLTARVRQCCCCTGFPSSSYNFRDVVPHLQGRAWVTMDLLGFGLSDKPRPHRYSLLEQADLVATVVAETTTGPVQIVAHDMGTPWC